MSRIELINAELLAAQLLAIPDKIRTAVERKALGEANKLVVGKLRDNAPSETGALKKSFVYDIRRYKNDSVIAGLVGVNYDYVGTVQRNKSGKKKFKKDKNATGNRRRPAKYWHLVDLGFKDRKGNKVEGMNVREKTMNELTPQIQRLLEDAVIEALNQ